MLIEDFSMTDHYESWLRTVQWLIIMSADQGPFNDWSLWVLIRTVKWLITMSADLGPLNDWSLWLLIKERSMTTNYQFVWLFTDSAHLEPCRDSWTTTSPRTMIKNSIMNIISSVPWKEWIWVWGTCLQCFYLTLLTLPSYFLAFCPVYSLEIFI